MSQSFRNYFLPVVTVDCRLDPGDDKQGVRGVGVAHLLGVPADTEAVLPATVPPRPEPRPFVWRSQPRLASSDTAILCNLHT